MKYVKKPIEVEAVQWTGLEADLPLVFALVPKKEDGSFDVPNNGTEIEPGIGFTPPSGELVIPTLEGDMVARPGDWIIQGVKGEIYPCKSDIFAMTYDAVPPKVEARPGESP
jgi:hypothetical protein